MTRTPLIITGFLLFAGLALAPIAQADEPAPPKDQPATTAPATTDTPKTADSSPRDRIIDRMRERRQSMRDGETLGPGAPGGPGRPGPNGPGGPLQGPPDGNRPPPLTAAQQKQALEVLSEINPDLADKIREAQKTAPDRASGILRRFGPKLLELAELKTSDPDLYNLKVTDQRYNFDTFRLVRQLHEAREDGDDAKVQRLTNRLRDLLNKHFDVRIKLREHELAMLEQRIKDIREELKDHHDRKQQLIDEQVDRLISDNPPPQPPQRDADAGDKSAE